MIDFEVAIIDNVVMNQVSIDEIRRDLQSFLQRLESGESLIITQDGRPVAEIKPIVSNSETLRPFGLCKGEFVVPDDFDDPLPESIIKEFALK